MARIPHLAVQRVGSVFWFCLTASGRPELPIRRTAAAPADAGANYARIYHPLLESGIYLAPSAWEVGFLSAAHSETDIDILADALGNAVRSALPDG